MQPYSHHLHFHPQAHQHHPVAATAHLAPSAAPQVDAQIRLRKEISKEITKVYINFKKEALQHHISESSQAENWLNFASEQLRELLRKIERKREFQMSQQVDTLLRNLRSTLHKIVEEKQKTGGYDMGRIVRWQEYCLDDLSNLLDAVKGYSKKPQELVTIVDGACFVCNQKHVAIPMLVKCCCCDNRCHDSCSSRALRFLSLDERGQRVFSIICNQHSFTCIDSQTVPGMSVLSVDDDRLRLTIPPEFEDSSLPEAAAVTQPLPNDLVSYTVKCGHSSNCSHSFDLLRDRWLLQRHTGHILVYKNLRTMLGVENLQRLAPSDSRCPWFDSSLSPILLLSVNAQDEGLKQDIQSAVQSTLFKNTLLLKHRCIASVCENLDDAFRIAGSLRSLDHHRDEMNSVCHVQPFVVRPTYHLLVEGIPSGKQIEQVLNDRFFAKVERSQQKGNRAIVTMATQAMALECFIEKQRSDMTVTLFYPQLQHQGCRSRFVRITNIPDGWRWEELRAELEKHAAITEDVHENPDHLRQNMLLLKQQSEAMRRTLLGKILSDQCIVRARSVGFRQDQEPPGPYRDYIYEGTHVVVELTNEVRASAFRAAVDEIRLALPSSTARLVAMLVPQEQGQRYFVIQT